MNNRFLFFLIVILFSSCTIACCFSYPLFSELASLTSYEQSYINDLHESENYNYEKENFSVLVLDWFEVVNDFFPKYTPIKVIDVNTKKTYYVQRGGGYNHADVEPINKENMLIFKSIYSNEWSWVRRPVWVQIGNNYVAASVNGMPHGFSLITDNGMDGHTCIHFLNSKTHGTKVVDAAHQNCVQQAKQRENELKQMLYK